jgi:lysophospholipase L1-like esterase
MPTHPKRLITLWCFGLIVGTAVIAATSPLFVRSYLPEQRDPVRGRYVPVAGSEYRWRSEGYATTKIGAHGMPGRVDVGQPVPDSIRVALWGDSQAEGVCVGDDDKLFAQIQRIGRAAGRSIEVLPFARSGEDATDWLAQMPSVERALAIDLHVLVVAELPDLLAVDQPSLDRERSERDVAFQSAIASRVPAFAIQAIRQLLRDADDKPRRWRFSLGPVVKPEPAVAVAAFASRAKWTRVMQTVRSTSDRPIIIAYAPRSPKISAGNIDLTDPWGEQFQTMERAAANAAVGVVDTSDALGDAAREGRWPHGFDNGQIGSGHLNAIGYRVIAEQICPAIIAWFDRGPGASAPRLMNHPG